MSPDSVPTKGSDPGLADFVKRTRSATVKQVKNVAGASTSGVHLAVEGGKGSTASIYKVRTAWDHKDKSKRTRCVRTMGTEGGGGHEVWLTLWSKAHADMVAIGTALSQAPSWKRSAEDANRYEHGPVSVQLDEAKGTATLIYTESRKRPFTAAGFSARLRGLFDELSALVASSGRQPAPGAAPARRAPVTEVVPSDKKEPRREVEPAAAPSPVHATPADLVAALESGGTEAYKEGAKVRIEGHVADVAVADDAKGKRLTLTIGGVGEPSAGALAACRVALGNPTFSARHVGGDSLAIKRSFRSTPGPPDIREAMDYAEKFLRALASGPPPPEAGPPERPPEKPREEPAEKPPEGPAEAAPSVDLPQPDSVPPAGTEATLPEPQAAAVAEQGDDLAGVIVEVEEVSLEELLGSPAEETSAPAVAGPADSGPAAPEPPEALPPTVIPRPGPPEAAPAPPAAEETSAPAETAPPPAGDEPAVKLPEEVPDIAFGQYRALRAIGRDVLGVLYEGEDTETGEAVSIKVIDREHTQNLKFAREFIRESWVAARLKHEGLKRILTAGRTDAHIYYYVAEYAEARSAREIVESGEGFSHAEASRVVGAVGEALAFAHSQKVFHGDIRPSYVLLTPDGGVKLAEMAVAMNVFRCVDRLLLGHGWCVADALVDEENDARTEVQRLIRERGVIPWYMAPELVLPRGEADARADIYGLGATWYYMVTGRQPFEGTPPLEMLSGQGGRAVPAHEVDPSIPLGVSLLIQRMMVPFPMERFQLIEEVLAELERMKGG